MTLQYVFNGDADGLCALQQLRLVDLRSATLLDRYQPLQGFKIDFLMAFILRAEGRAEYANLVPVKDIFGEGPPLAAH